MGPLVKCGCILNGSGLCGLVGVSVLVLSLSAVCVVPFSVVGSSNLLESLMSNIVVYSSDVNLMFVPYRKGLSLYSLHRLLRMYASVLSASEWWVMAGFDVLMSNLNTCMSVTAPGSGAVHLQQTLAHALSLPFHTPVGCRWEDT